jgi:hypothetical protein
MLDPCAGRSRFSSGPARVSRSRSISRKGAIDGSPRVLDRVTGSIGRVVDVVTGMFHRSGMTVVVMVVAGRHGEPRGGEYRGGERTADQLAHRTNLLVIDLDVRAHPVCFERSEMRATRPAHADTCSPRSAFSLV